MGINPDAWVIPLADIATVTMTAGSITAMTFESAKKFSYIKGKERSVKANYVSKAPYGYTHTVEAVVFDALVAARYEIAAWRYIPLAVVVQNANGEYLIYGMSMDTDLPDPAGAGVYLLDELNLATADAGGGIVLKFGTRSDEYEPTAPPTLAIAAGTAAFLVTNSYA
jgi:hypothetical protein